jgi:DNA-binding transcriptional regulator PaaX
MGKSFVEIASEMGISERTARRAIWRLASESQDSTANAIE